MDLGDELPAAEHSSSDDDEGERGEEEGGTEVRGAGEDKGVGRVAAAEDPGTKWGSVEQQQQQQLPLAATAGHDAATAALAAPAAPDTTTSSSKDGASLPVPDAGAGAAGAAAAAGVGGSHVVKARKPQMTGSTPVHVSAKDSILTDLTDHWGVARHEGLLNLGVVVLLATNIR